LFIKWINAFFSFIVCILIYQCFCARICKFDIFVSMKQEKTAFHIGGFVQLHNQTLM
jgi:hypothetical protein